MSQPFKPTTASHPVIVHTKNMTASLVKPRHQKARRRCPTSTTTGQCSGREPLFMSYSPSPKAWNRSPLFAPCTGAAAGRSLVRDRHVMVMLVRRDELPVTMTPRCRRFMGIRWYRERRIAHARVFHVTSDSIMFRPTAPVAIERATSWRRFGYWLLMHRSPRRRRAPARSARNR